MADTNKGEALGWNDEATVTTSEFEVLPAGDYEYEVTGFQRERFDGSDNMGACPVAVIQLRCRNEKTSGTVFTRLYLNSKVIFRITNFFKSCGLLPPDADDGAKFSMSLFEKCVGTRGLCKVKIREYTPRNGGEKRESNDVEFVMPPKGTSRPGGESPWDDDNGGGF